jgi:hypothetical protein
MAGPDFTLLPPAIVPCTFMRSKLCYECVCDMLGCWEAFADDQAIVFSKVRFSRLCHHG